MLNTNLSLYCSHLSLAVRARLIKSPVVHLCDQSPGNLLFQNTARRKRVLWASSSRKNSKQLHLFFFFLPYWNFISVPVVPNDQIYRCQKPKINCVFWWNILKGAVHCLTIWGRKANNTIHDSRLEGNENMKFRRIGRGSFVLDVIPHYPRIPTVLICS